MINWTLLKPVRPTRCEIEIPNATNEIAKCMKAKCGVKKRTKCLDGLEINTSKIFKIYCKRLKYSGQK